MRPSAEIREQRQAILAGRWVNRSPHVDGEACLAWKDGGCTKGLSVRAKEWISQAIDELFPGTRTDELTWRIQTWNDRACPNEQAALDVLERAEKLALIAESQT